MLKGNLKEINFLHTNQIVSLMTKQVGERHLDLPENIKIKKIYNELIIIKERENIPLKNDNGRYWEYFLSFPEKKIETIDSLGLSIEMGILEASKLEKHKYSKNNVNKKEYCELIDYDTVKFPLKIRNRRPGDKFNPLNMKGHKRIKDFFIDLKIPRNRRNNIPFLVDNKGKIIWIVGLRLDNRVKIDNTTKKILCVKITFSNQNNQKSEKV